MKKILFTLALLISFTSFGQTLPDKLFITDKFDPKSESSIYSYFDKNGTEYIEGIWEMQSTSNAEYKFAILKDEIGYTGIIINTNNPRYTPGEIKFKIEPTASTALATMRWTMGDKSTVRKRIAKVNENVTISVDLSLPSEVRDKTLLTLLYKVYPAFKPGSIGSGNRTGEWAGNGSGIIISKSGYIVTNNHVIEDADDIEVEFQVNNEIVKYNAQLVQADKTNDLAIIKIVDINFDGVPNIPFNFKTRSSDVGTKVYAFGYPMALTVMGKEIKVTDGIISSKTGFDGNITTYQITAPIQGGNSGGPLFDDKGNFIGINSSGLGADVAENVGYSIKTSYVLNLIDILPKNIDLPSSTRLQSLPLTSQIKEISKYVVLIKVK